MKRMKSVGTVLFVIVFCCMAGDCPGGAIIGGGETGGSDRDFSALPRLFISTGRASVAALDSPGSLEGMPAINELLKTEDGEVEEVESVAVNGIGNLIAMISFAEISRTREIRVYRDAAAIDGEQTPVRVVSGDATRLNGSIGGLSMDMKLDKQRDILYVFIAREREAGEDNLRRDELREILVFEGTSQASFNGNIAPNRVIDLGELSQVGFMAVDSANNTIYVASNRNRRILAFDNASTLEGTPAPDRIIDNEGFGTTFLGQGSELLFQAIAADGTDTLYLYTANNRLFVIENASTLDSENAPVELLIPLVPNEIGFENFTPQDVYVDGNGTAYVMGGPDLNPIPPNITVLVFDDIKSQSGGIVSDRWFRIDINEFVRPEAIRIAE
ncbi:MAG: hypothetical protein MI923_20570 [Phycisphaerales bacterium]|nr:hypothetical protein [Phycisphaerales bacterium]